MSHMIWQKNSQTLALIQVIPKNSDQHTTDTSYIHFTSQPLASLGMAESRANRCSSSALDKQVFWITKLTDSFLPASSIWTFQVSFTSPFWHLMASCYKESILERRVVSKLVFCCCRILAFSSMQILSASIVSHVLNIKQSMSPRKAYGTLQNC